MKKTQLDSTRLEKCSTRLDSTRLEKSRVLLEFKMIRGSLQGYDDDCRRDFKDFKYIFISFIIVIWINVVEQIEFTGVRESCKIGWKVR